MLEFKKKNRLKRFLYSKFTILLLLAILVIVARSTYGVYKKAKVANERFEVVEEQYASLEARKSDVEKKNNELKTELGIEEELRTKFNVAKENEKVIIIVENEVEEEIVPEKPKGFWDKLKSLFK